MATSFVTTDTADLRSGITSIVAAAAIDPTKQDELVARIVELVGGSQAPGGAAAPRGDQDLVASSMEVTQTTAANELVDGETFTRRARPAVVYAGLAFIFVLHVLLPALTYLGVGTPPAQAPSLPTEFWWAWTGVVSVWMIGRSYEKVNRPGKLSSLITGTLVK
jgi:hypothetical protein